MALVKCVHGHYYDAEKYAQCPYCRTETPDLQQDDRTQAAALTDDSKTLGYMAYSLDDDDKTVGILAGQLGSPVVGWLVCVKGPERGRDYRLHAGKNHVGRSSEMDVEVADGKISRCRHFTVVFDPKANCFMIVPGEGTLTYLDGEGLRQPKKLEENMKITAGESEFAFRSFCREGVAWDEENEASD